MRWVWASLVATLAVAVALVIYAYDQARADPAVHRATVALADWPQGAAPISVALLSDIHYPSAAMDDGRLARIVAQVNALHPDLVVIAGDFIAGHKRGSAAAAAPGLARGLSRLRARFGVIAVPGNHDYWTGMDGVRSALAAAHIKLVANGAVRAGPLAIAAIDDDFSGHADVPATMAQLRDVPGARVALTHSPDIDGSIPDDIGLLLAGHTHCGQVLLPGIGALVRVWRAGSPLPCGLTQQGRRVTIVTGGLGTSGGPFRLGAPPDLWLVSIGPQAR